MSDGSLEFYLGTHETNWLERTDIPLFISRRRLMRRKRLPLARGPWALDSGGFSELSLHGGWNLTPTDYACEVQRYKAEIGNMQWAAPQDWMCEPVMLAKTGLTVEEHQRRTVDNFCALQTLAQNIHWAPVLQGWTLSDYMRCVEMYDRAGVDLRNERIVGIGTVCRRQGTKDAEVIIQRLALMGIRLHGFGLKISGLRRVAHYLTSADSMAWSFQARKRAPLSGCTHKTCANCIKWAMQWRGQAIRSIERALRQPRQMLLGEAA